MNFSIKKQISFKVGASVTPEQLADIFKQAGLRRPVNDLPRLQQMIEQADLVVTAWNEDKLIGVARAITDFSYCCYLSDLAVHQDYQKQGIGKELIRLVQKELGEEVTVLLLSAPTAMEYYPRIGFDTIENGFIIPRKR